MESYDVLAIGSGVLDIFIKSEKFKVIKSDEVQGGIAICEVYGGKMEVDEVTISSGGGGTNTAYSFARKDLKTAVICEMGNDPASLIVHRDMENVGVDTRFIVQEADETTAVSTILISEDGGRSIIVYRGASAMLDNKDVPWEKIKARWVHVTSLGGNMSLLTKILEWARDNNSRVSFNPGITEIEKGKKLLSLLPMVEILFLNRAEAKRVFDRDYCVEGSGYPEGAVVTVITDAERGGVICEGGKCVSYKTTRPKKVVDTTGSGDSFASGMVAGVLYGLSYRDSILWGTKNASACVAGVGAKYGSLSLAEVR